MRKVLSYFAVVLFLIFSWVNQGIAASNLEEGVKELAEKISQSMLEKQKQKIAIIDFSDLNGNVTALGQFMAEELTTQLFMIAPGKFEVVERRQIMKLEEELVLGQVGIIEEKGIKKMGQVLGVDAIVTGSMTDLGNTVKINARMVAVESAKVFAVAATDIPKTGMVADLIGKQVEKRPGVIQALPANNATGKQEIKGVQGMGKVFQNDRMKVTMKSIKKVGNTVLVTLFFENLEEKPYRFWLMGSSNTYLLNEDGERWNYKNDTANTGDGSRVTLIPKTKLLSKFTFESRGSKDGKLFNLVSKIDTTTESQGYNNPIDIVINDIPTE